jgi:4a-hydroxytetrahydrobiopterin dehydratase
VKIFKGQDLLDAVMEAPGWSMESGELVRTETFKDFAGAMEFVNRVASIAEAAAHHPDIDIRYNKVRLGLVTHDAGGITQKDIDVAREIAAAAVETE